MPKMNMATMQKLIQARKERGKRAGTTGYDPGRMPTPAPVTRYTKRVKA